MKLRMLLSNTLRSLKRDIKRSFLTMLGIIIGVAAIITIVALGDGYKKKIIADMTKNKSEYITLDASFISDNFYAKIDEQTYYNKKNKNLLEELDVVRNVDFLYTNIEGNEIIELISGDKSITGIVSKLKETKKYDNIIGRNINEIDIEEKKRVLVISESLINSEFKDDQLLLGNLVKINNVPFEIVGIIKDGEEDISLFSSYDEIQVPYETYKKYFQTEKKITGYKIELEKDMNVDDSIKAIENTLNSAIKVEGGKFYVNDTSGMISMLGSILNTITIFISLVAGISLFIAGIGIMNMSYTLVSERTLEIGIKRAIGAQKSDIKKEFLLEGILISVTGGLIGYILSIVIANIISTFMGMIITPNLFTASIAIIISALVGIFSSILPASKASNANTIDILK